MYAKIFSQQNTLNHATKEAIRLLLFFAHVETVINILRDFDFQTWLFELNVSEEDDFNDWLANLLVEVSHEIQDKRFNRVASYLIDVLHTEALREAEAKGVGLPIWHFFVSQSQGGKSNKLDFTTRYFELGSATPTDITADGRKLTLELEVIHSSANAAATFQSNFDAGTPMAFRLHAVGNGYPVIGTSSLKPTFSLACPPSKIVLANAIPLDDLLTQTITVEVEQANLAVLTTINAQSAI
jgi:hypothetical protein